MKQGKREKKKQVVAMAGKEEQGFYLDKGTIEG